MKKRWLVVILFLSLIFGGTGGCAESLPVDNTQSVAVEDIQVIDEHDEIGSGISEEGSYSSPEDVATYIFLFGKLPHNYLTKNEAKDLGWISSEGNLWEVSKGMSIGGDRFGNREGLLPDAEGRQWFECDVNYQGGYRGPERLVYSNDGLIYYTEDHYASFIEMGVEDYESD